jgi:hypothetical protein
LTGHLRPRVPPLGGLDKERRSSPLPIIGGRGTRMAGGRNRHAGTQPQPRTSGSAPARFPPLTHDVSGTRPIGLDPALNTHEVRARPAVTAISLRTTHRGGKWSRSRPLRRIQRRAVAGSDRRAPVPLQSATGAPAAAIASGTMPTVSDAAGSRTRSGVFARSIPMVPSQRRRLR